MRIKLEFATRVRYQASVGFDSFEFTWRVRHDFGASYPWGRSAQVHWLGFHIWGQYLRPRGLTEMVTAETLHAISPEAAEHWRRQ